MWYHKTSQSRRLVLLPQITCLFINNINLLSVATPVWPMLVSYCTMWLFLSNRFMVCQNQYLNQQICIGTFFSALAHSSQGTQSVSTIKTNLVRHYHKCEWVFMWNMLFLPNFGHNQCQHTWSRSQIQNHTIVHLVGVMLLYVDRLIVTFCNYFVKVPK